MSNAAVLGLAVLVDLLIGDPRWLLPHPVRVIGWAIERLERILRKTLPPRAGGVVLAVLIPGGVYAVMSFATNFLLKFPYIGSAAIVLLLSTTIAIRGLVGEAAKIILLLRKGELPRARGELKSLAGRDTENLGPPEIVRAVIESLAENASDGIVAPIFYYALGGLPLAMAYKAVNTLDSMVGYKNERYIRFGWASARLDDLANLIPARLTGLFISLASVLPGMSIRRAFMTMLRDGGKHPSPNSGVPMAAMAGALGITLGGPAVYGGKLLKKPFIGDAGSPPSLDSARGAMRLTLLGSLFGAAVFAVLGALL